MRVMSVKWYSVHIKSKTRAVRRDKRSRIQSAEPAEVLHATSVANWWSTCSLAISLARSASDFHPSFANTTYGTSSVHARDGMRTRNSEAAAAAAQMNYPRKDAEERMSWSPFKMGAFTLELSHPFGMIRKESN